MKDMIENGTTYGELLALLRKDLQLDPTTDLLPHTIEASTNSAPQSRGTVRTATQAIVTATATFLSSWTVFQQGTYLLASAAGLTARTDGVYLATGYVLWDVGATGIRQLGIAKNGVLAAPLNLVTHPTLAAIGVGEQVAGIVPASAGDVLTLEVVHNQGANVTLQASDMEAWYLGNGQQ